VEYISFRMSNIETNTPTLPSGKGKGKRMPKKQPRTSEPAASGDEEWRPEEESDSEAEIAFVSNPESEPESELESEPESEPESELESEPEPEPEPAGEAGSDADAIIASFNEFPVEKQERVLVLIFKKLFDKVYPAETCVKFYTILQESQTFPLNFLTFMEEAIQLVNRRDAIQNAIETFVLECRELVPEDVACGDKIDILNQFKPHHKTFIESVKALELKPKAKATKAKRAAPKSKRKGPKRTGWYGRRKAAK
jgi:hypothetical protein